MTPKTDPIAAVSTPRGVGGVAMIRISGEGAVVCADRIFKPSSGMPLTDAAHARAYHGNIKRGGVTIDDGMATVFYAPHSYTGEDTVEITCHGGVLITNEVLAAALEAGARPAEAGEFTRWAFVSGKLSLSEAEAVGELIHAKTSAQLALSAPGARRSLSSAADSLCSRLTELIARVAVRIDYPEEDLADIDEAELLSETVSLCGELDALRATYRTGRAVFEGIDTVICGRPNAGKSTLYNLFTGEDTAIVTDTPGTTRDTLTADVSAGTVLLHLSDTAGIRETEDKIEAIGVSRARDRIGTAELLITVHDSSVPPTDEDIEILSSPVTVKLAVINKTDLNDSAFAADYESLAHRAGAKPILCALSERRGFDELVSAINYAFTDGELRLGTDAVITSARQSAEAEAAHASLLSAADALQAGLPVDIAVSELEAALSALSRLDGREVADEVISEIFSKFCVGK